ncbi:hypothetical protein [Nocardia sp. CA-290969]|uniref:hypothetical protein n=1 Tax=Nocardia sp. CA-290969 TaxID=3239986 RepID=UPI003D8FE150
MNPMSTERSALSVAVQVIAGVLGAAAGLLWLGCVGIALPFHLGSDPAADPHGYGLILGTVFSLPTGLVAALAAPFSFPAGHRWWSAGIVIPVLVVTAVLWVAFIATS